MTASIGQGQSQCVMVDGSVELGALFNGTDCAGTTDIDITNSSVGLGLDCTDCGTGLLNVGSVAGTFVASGNNDQCQITVEVVTLDFTAQTVSGSNCNLLEYTAISTLSGAVTYTWTFPNGDEVTGEVIQYDLVSTDPQPMVTLTADNGDCLLQYSESVDLTGPSPDLSFVGIGTGQPPQLSVFDYGDSECMVSYCVANPLTDNIVSITHEDNATSSGAGFEYFVDFNGVTVYSATTPPVSFGIDLSGVATGYHDIDYRIVSGSGCEAIKNYDLYWEDFSSPDLSIMNLTPSSTENCVGDVIQVEFTASGTNPEGVDYYYAIGCPAALYADLVPFDGLTPLALNPSGGLDASIVADIVLDTTSCGCSNQEYRVYAIVQSPCRPEPSIAGSLNLEVGLDLEADFQAPETACLNSSEEFSWANSTLSVFGVPYCFPALSWSYTTPSGVVTDNIGSETLEVLFSEEGVYEVCLEVSSPNCNSSQAVVCHQICVKPPIVAADVVTQLDAPAPICVPYVYTPTVSYTPSGCGTTTYLWEIEPPSGEPYTLSGEVAPTFSFDQPGDYGVKLTVDNGCQPAYLEQTIVTVGAPPVATADFPSVPGCQGNDLVLDDLLCFNLNDSPLISAEISVHEGSGDCLGQGAEVWTTGAVSSLPADISHGNCTDDGLPPAFVFSVPADASGEYTVVAQVETECGSDCASFTIVVDDQGTIVVPLPDTVCTGYVIDPSADPDYAGCVWEIGGQLYTPGTNETFEIDATTEITITCGGGVCTNSGSTTVDVFTQVTPTITRDAPSVCADGSSTVTLTATGSGLSDYQWHTGPCGTGTLLSGETANTLSITSAGTYSVTTTDGNGCTACAETTIIDDVGPSFDCDVQEFCESETSETASLSCLSSPPGGWTGSLPTFTLTDDSGAEIDLSVTSSPQDPASTEIAIGELMTAIGDITTSTDFELSYTWTSPSGCTYSDSFTLTINALATDFPESTPVCQGEVLVFDGGASGSWDFSELITAGIPAANISVNADGDLELTTDETTPAGIYDGLSYGGDCGLRVYDDITILQSPETSLSHPSEVCLNAEIAIEVDLGSSSSASLSFDHADGLFDLTLISPISTMTASDLGVESTTPGTLLLTATQEHLISGVLYTCLDTTISTVTFSEIPASAVLEDVCAGAEFSPSFCTDPLVDGFDLAIGGQSYTSCPITLTGLSGEQDYALTMVYGVDCQSTVNGSMEIQEELTYSYTVVSDPCLPEAIIDIDELNGTITSVTFSPSGVFEDDILTQAAVIPVTDPSQDVSIEVSMTITDGECTTTTETFVVEYIAPLEAQVSIPPGVSICSPADIPFLIDQIGSSRVDSIIMLPGDGAEPATYIDDYAGISHVYDSPVDTTTFTATFYLFNQCDTDTLDISILVDPPVFSAFIDDVYGVCPGQEVNLTPTLIGSLLAAEVQTPLGLSMDLVSTDSQFIFRVEETQFAGDFPVQIVLRPECGEETVLTTIVRVHEQPAPAISVAARCAGTESTFAITDPDLELVYSWTFSDGGTGSGAIVDRIMPLPGPAEVSVTAESIFGCLGTETVSFNTPGFYVEGPNDTISCGDIALLLNVNATIDQTVSWTITGGEQTAPIVYNTDGAYHIFEASSDGVSVNEYTIFLSAYDATADCTVDEEFTVRCLPTGNPEIQLLLDPLDGFVNAPQVEQLYRCAEDPLPFRGVAADISSCEFSYSGDLNICTPVSECGEMGEICFSKGISQGVITMTTTNSYLCAASDSVIIRSKCDDQINVFTPNAFTPDANGVNDYWCPIVDTKGNEVEEYLVEVYDRNGCVVWASDELGVEWDGNAIYACGEGSKEFGTDFYIKDQMYTWMVRIEYAVKGTNEKPVLVDKGSVVVLR